MKWIWSSLKWGFAIWFGLGVYAVFKTADAPQSSSTRSRTDTYSQVEYVDPVPESLPWIKRMDEFCDRYQSAKNDIQRSAVHQEAQKFLRSVRIKGVKGRLRDLDTTHGGGRAMVAVTVGKFVFSSGLMDSIRKGHKVYKQLSKMEEGQCVIFDARINRSYGAFREEKQTCQRDTYFVGFRSIRPCEK